MSTGHNVDPSEQAVAESAKKERWWRRFHRRLTFLIVGLVTSTLFVMHHFDHGVYFQSITTPDGHEVAGLFLAKSAILVILVGFIFALSTHFNWIDHCFDLVHKRLERKSTGQEYDLQHIFNALHTHLMESKELERTVKGLFIDYWQLLKDRGATAASRSDAPIGSIERRLFKLLQEAKACVQQRHFALKPWTAAQFKEYPEPQYETADFAIYSTNVGSLKSGSYYGNNLLFQSRFVGYNRDAIKRNLSAGNLDFKIQRVFVFSRRLADIPEELEALYKVVFEMMRAGVGVYVLPLETAEHVLGDNPKDFTIFQRRDGSEAGIYSEATLHESVIYTMTVTALKTEIDELVDQFRRLLRVSQAVSDKVTSAEKLKALLLSSGH